MRPIERPAGEAHRRDHHEKQETNHTGHPAPHRGDPNERIEWEMTDGPAEWIGTHVSFDLKQEGNYTIVLFKHQGWREPVEFMAHCTTKWTTYLLSLKQLLETGTGAPHPRDVLISNWH